MGKAHKTINYEGKKKPQFFKVFLPGATDHRLGIPREFLKHIEDGLCGTAHLTGPSGNVWHVALDEDVNGLHFQSGWQDFAQDHSLKFGYMMVFRYDGNLHFAVQIFDRSGCEKEDAFYVESCQDVSDYEECKKRKKVRETAAKDLNITTCKVCEGTLPTPQQSQHNEAINSNRMDPPKSFRWVHLSCITMNYQPEGHLRKIIVTSNEGSKIKAACGVDSNCSLQYNQVAGQGSPYKKPVEFTQTEKQKAKRKRRNIQYVINSRSGSLKSQRRDVTAEEVRRAFEGAMSFKSKRPFFLVVMRPSYVYFGFLVALPMCSLAYLPKRNQVLVLYDPRGRAWKVKYIMNRKYGCFSSGWAALTYANNLEKDDVCIFELVGRDKLQLHIFRVAREITPLIKHVIPRKRLNSG